MKKKILIGVASVIALVIVLGLLQALVIPKYATNQEGLLTGAYYDHAGGHDVIFIGDCEVYENFVPSVLWREYGITSYIRGNGQQLVWHSYSLLRETFEYEKPKVVVFNVYALKYGEPQNEELNRQIFDGMKWSEAKIDGINDSMLEDEKFWHYVFPLLHFHSRITELESEDFEYWFSTPELMADNGYLINTGTDPMPEQPPAPDEPDEPLPERAMEYLEKIRLLCEENGSELVLVKAPTNPTAFYWFDQWEEQIIEYASEKGVEYYNFIPEAENIGIDWQTDTHDKGLHLNVYGAEKLTKYFGSILRDNHGLTSHKDEADTAERWNSYYSEYERKKKEMENRVDEKS